MMSLELIQRHHNDVFLPKANRLKRESEQLGNEIEFSIEYEGAYITFEHYTYYIDKVENSIVELYDEELDQIKKVPLNLIRQDLSFQ